MIGNVEYYTTLTFALITISLSIHQAQGQTRTCNLLSRPHPNGFCGEQLALLHGNLCFLIRRSYPQFFPIVKRSVSREPENNIHPSVSTVLDADLKDIHLTAYQDYEKDVSSSFSTDNILLSSLKSSDISEHLPKSKTTSDFIDFLQKRNTRSKRSLVCECCYGPCTVRIIARYC